MDHDGEEGDKHYVRRPMNAFLIFCKGQRRIVQKKNPDLDNRGVTRILADLWANLQPEEKVVYTDFAKQYWDAYLKTNPNFRYKYKPKKPYVSQRSCKPRGKPKNAKLMQNEVNLIPEGSIIPETSVSAESMSQCVLCENDTPDYNMKSIRRTLVIQGHSDIFTFKHALESEILSFLPSDGKYCFSCLHACQRVSDMKMNLESIISGETLTGRDMSKNSKRKAESEIPLPEKNMKRSCMGEEIAEHQVQLSESEQTRFCLDDVKIEPEYEIQSEANFERNTDSPKEDQIEFEVHINPDYFDKEEPEEEIQTKKEIDESLPELSNDISTETCAADVKKEPESEIQTDMNEDNDSRRLSAVEVKDEAECLSHLTGVNVPLTESIQRSSSGEEKIQSVNIMQSQISGVKPLLQFSSGSACEAHEKAVLENKMQNEFLGVKSVNKDPCYTVTSANSSTSIGNSVPGNQISEVTVFNRMPLIGCIGTPSVPGNQISGVNLTNRMQLIGCIGTPSVPGNQVSGVNLTNGVPLIGCIGTPSVPGNQMSGVNLINGMPLIGCIGTPSMPGNQITGVNLTNRMPLIGCIGTQSAPGNQISGVNLINRMPLLQIVPTSSCIAESKAEPGNQVSVGQLTHTTSTLPENQMQSAVSTVNSVNNKRLFRLIPLSSYIAEKKTEPGNWVSVGHLTNTTSTLPENQTQSAVCTVSMAGSVQLSRNKAGPLEADQNKLPENNVQSQVGQVPNQLQLHAGNTVPAHQIQMQVPGVSFVSQTQVGQQQPGSDSAIQAQVQMQQSADDSATQELVKMQPADVNSESQTKVLKETLSVSSACKEQVQERLSGLNSASQKKQLPYVNNLKNLYKEQKQPSDVNSGNQMQVQVQPSGVNLGSQKQVHVQQSEVNSGNQKPGEVQQTDVNSGSQKPVQMQPSGVNLGSQKQEQEQPSGVYSGSPKQSFGLNSSNQKRVKQSGVNFSSQNQVQVQPSGMNFSSQKPQQLQPSGFIVSGQNQEQVQHSGMGISSQKQVKPSGDFSIGQNQEQVQQSCVDSSSQEQQSSYFNGYLFNRFENELQGHDIGVHYECFSANEKQQAQNVPFTNDLKTQKEVINKLKHCRNFDALVVTAFQIKQVRNCIKQKILKDIDRDCERICSTDSVLGNLLKFDLASSGKMDTNIFDKVILEMQKTIPFLTRVLRAICLSLMFKPTTKYTLVMMFAMGMHVRNPNMSYVQQLNTCLVDEYESGEVLNILSKFSITLDSDAKEKFVRRMKKLRPHLLDNKAKGNESVDSGDVSATNDNSLETFLLPPIIDNENDEEFIHFIDKAQNCSDIEDFVELALERKEVRSRVEYVLVREVDGACETMSVKTYGRRDLLRDHIAAQDKIQTDLFDAVGQEILERNPFLYHVLKTMCTVKSTTPCTLAAIFAMGIQIRCKQLSYLQQLNSILLNKDIYLLNKLCHFHFTLCSNAEKTLFKKKKEVKAQFLADEDERKKKLSKVQIFHSLLPAANQVNTEKKNDDKIQTTLSTEEKMEESSTETDANEPLKKLSKVHLSHSLLPGTSERNTKTCNTEKKNNSVLTTHITEGNKEESSKGEVDANSDTDSATLDLDADTERSSVDLNRQTNQEEKTNLSTRKLFNPLVHVRPEERKAADDLLYKVDSKPVDRKPVDSKQVDSKPVDSQQVDSKPVDSKPVDSKPVDSKPVDSNQVDSKPKKKRRGKDCSGIKPYYETAKSMAEAEYKALIEQYKTMLMSISAPATEDHEVSMRTRNINKSTVKLDRSLEDLGLLEVRYIDTYIGSQVFAKSEIKKGALVCEYTGENITEEEGILRLQKNKNPGCYIYFYKKDGKNMCVDGTHGGVAKYINDQHIRPNCKVKHYNGKLAVFALKDINVGNEIRYDYGDPKAYWRKGFLKLFPQLQVTDELQRASLVIIPTDKELMASQHEKKVFMALVGRQKMILSNQWVSDSIQNGCLQDKEEYIVKGTELGLWSATENYQEFKYQIGHGVFTNITIDEISFLLNAIGGEEQLLRTEETVYICADNELLSSDCCVHKEWIFQSISKGMVISTDLYHSTNTDYISDSEPESTVISFRGIQNKEKITVQTVKRSKTSGKSTKRLCCVYCEDLTTKLHRHLEQKHANELEVARALSIFT